MTSLIAAVCLVPSQLAVRSSSVSLVPPEPLPLGGYTQRPERPFEPGGDDLRVRAIVLGDGSERVAIVSAEMLTIPESLHREVGSRLPKDVRVFLSATHTHCAPDSQMLNERMTIKVPGIASFDRKWQAWYADRIASAVLDALDQEPAIGASMLVGRSFAPINRKRRPFALPDPMATKVQLRERSDAAGGARLFHFSAHPVLYGPEEMRLRGDWPGAYAAKTGALPLVGAIADVSPLASASEPGSPVEAFLNSLQRRAALSENLGNPTWASPAPLAWAEVPIDLGPATPHPEFARRYGAPDALARTLVRSFAPTSATVAAVRLGKLAIVGVPGEPSSALGRRIVREGLGIGFRWVLVVSNVNGWIGYILEPADYDRGGYEATLGFHGRETGERLVKAAKTALRSLAGYRVSQTR